MVCWSTFKLSAESLRHFHLVSQITTLDQRNHPFITVCCICPVLEASSRADTLKTHKGEVWSISPDLYQSSGCHSTRSMTHSRTFTTNITESLVIHIQTANPFLIHFHCWAPEFAHLNTNCAENNILVVEFELFCYLASLTALVQIFRYVENTEAIYLLPLEY